MSVCVVVSSPSRSTPIWMSCCVSFSQLCAASTKAGSGTGRRDHRKPVKTFQSFGSGHQPTVRAVFRGNPVTFDFLTAFREKMLAETPYLEVTGILSGDDRVYSLGTDTKVLSTVFELMVRPLLFRLARDNDLVVREPAQQNDHPDFTLMRDELDSQKIAVDVKTTYRRFAADGAWRASFTWMACFMFSCPPWSFIIPVLITVPGFPRQPVGPGRVPSRTRCRPGGPLGGPPGL